MHLGACITVQSMNTSAGRQLADAARSNVPTKPFDLAKFSGEG
jgi:hypothetical protein